MVIIPKRNWRVCLHCGTIFKKGEEKQSINMISGVYDTCPNCMCPIKKDYSGNILNSVQASSYFNIVDMINNGDLSDKDEIVSLFERYSIPKKLWKRAIKK